MHEHEVCGGVEVGEADKGEVVVEAVEGGWHKVEAEHVFILEDVLAKRDRRVVPHVDGAAEQELEHLGDENNRDRVVRVVALSRPASCHKHALGIVVSSDLSVLGGTCATNIAM